MKTVWKSVLLSVAGSAIPVKELPVPEDAEFLCAKEQADELCVWYRCDPGKSVVTKKFAIIGTDHVAPDDGRYLGTGSFHAGRLMLHVFVLD